MKLNLIINCAFCIVNCALLISCASNRPIVTTHTERIEERVMPVAVGADTIEITLSRDMACHVLSTSGSKNNVTSVEIQRALLTKSNSESLNPNGKKSFQSVLSVGEKNNSEGVKSVDHRLLNRRSLSLWRKNVDNIKSTRGVNISRTTTDTTSTLRITLRPDTVFVPYTNHIRSDTIVVPDRICKTKLQKTQTANVLLILIIIVATIIFFLKDRKR